jgi:hypothetical protein
VGVVLALGELGVVEAVGVGVDGSVNIAMDELPKMKISRTGGRRSSEEMSNSMNELQLSLLKSLLKYFYHLFLISSSLVRSRILNAFYLDDVPRLPLLSFSHPIYVILPFLHTQPLV